MKQCEGIDCEEPVYMLPDESLAIAALQSSPLSFAADLELST